MRQSTRQRQTFGIDRTDGYFGTIAIHLKQPKPLFDTTGVFRRKVLRIPYVNVDC